MLIEASQASNGSVFHVLLYAAWDHENWPRFPPNKIYNCTIQWLFSARFWRALSCHWVAKALTLTEEMKHCWYRVVNSTTHVNKLNKALAGLVLHAVDVPLRTHSMPIFSIWDDICDAFTGWETAIRCKCIITVYTLDNSRVSKLGQTDIIRKHCVPWPILTRKKVLYTALNKTESICQVCLHT